MADILQAQKILDTLPAVLTPNTIYYVKVTETTCVMYVSNSTGTAALAVVSAV
jgi:hypothetical protein